MLKYFAIFALLVSPVFGQLDQETIDRLDSAAVTIKSNTGQGSGSVIIKEMINNKGEKERIAFVLTAAHVIENHRSVRTKIEDGKEVKVVEFSDPSVMREIQYKGRSVGEIQMKGRVIRYSDSEKGHDLALMMLYDSSPFKESIPFIQDKNYIPHKGTEVLLISSPGGSNFSNTLTAGVISQTGRLLGNIGSGSGYVFDSATAASMPGSSGGSLIRKEDGLYLAMLVRGSSDSFTFVIPIRRIYDWAQDADIDFLFDESAKIPTLQEVLDGSVE